MFVKGFGELTRAIYVSQFALSYGSVIHNHCQNNQRTKPSSHMCVV